MATAGQELTREKRQALASCDGLLMRARDELDQMIDRGAARGMSAQEVEELGPVALRVIQLRRRRRRLEHELHAIASEWDVA